MAAAAADDDEVLAWWECHAAGMNVPAISIKFGRPPHVILAEFAALGITVYHDDLEETDRRIAGALSRVSLSSRPEPHVEFARSMQHRVPVRRRVPMSKRQRGQDALAAGWTGRIRADLEDAGLLPRTNGRG